MLNIVWPLGMATSGEVGGYSERNICNRRFAAFAAYRLVLDLCDPNSRGWITCVPLPNRDPRINVAHPKSPRRGGTTPPYES